LKAVHPPPNRRNSTSFAAPLWTAEPTVRRQRSEIVALLSQRRARTGTDEAKVGESATRFLAMRVGGLVAEPQSGAPRTITDADVKRAVAPDSAPRDATQWSTRTMARHVGMSEAGSDSIARRGAAV
jgi:hypothetical protein